MINITSEVAEICGIHTGDGYLRDDGKRRELDISGSIEERGYYDNHVVPLFSRLFSIKVRARFFKARNTYGFVIRDRDVTRTLHEFGFPYGAKTYTVRIPKRILHDKTLLIAFLRGYFDTDGNVNFSKRYGTSSEFRKTRHVYPRIQLTTVSENLANDLKQALTFLGFKFMTYVSPIRRKNEKLTYGIHLNGKEASRWMETIGSKNPVKNSRYEVWKVQGFCPPNTSLEERQRILNKKLISSIQQGRVV